MRAPPTCGARSVDRDQDAVVSQDHLHVEQDATTVRFEDVHPFSRRLRDLASRGVLASEACQNIADIILVELQVETGQLAISLGIPSPCGESMEMTAVCQEGGRDDLADRIPKVVHRSLRRRNEEPAPTPTTPPASEAGAPSS